MSAEPVPNSALFDLTNKVAVVTGGSRGLGREISLGFAQYGASVVVAGRKEEVCQKVAAEITAATGRAAVGIGCHVGRWTDCDRLAEVAYGTFSRVDILVNNAGMSPLYPALAEVTEELSDKVAAANLKGAFRLSTLIGSRMAAGDGGSIINVSSVAASLPFPSPSAEAGSPARSWGPRSTWRARRPATRRAPPSGSTAEPASAAASGRTERPGAN